MKSQKRNTSAFKHFQRRVFRRDGYKCRICGSKEKLTVHHIIPYADNEELRYVTSNGFTVCDEHHEEIEKGEIRVGP